MTSDDVAYSLRRARSVPNSPAPFSGAVANIQRIEIVDPLTLRIMTKTPSPAFVEQIGLVYIVSRHATAGHASEDYRLPAVAVGTGPYRLARWIPGDRLELVRNDYYWGERPVFDTCTIRFMSNDAARLSALLSGSVSLIDNVPPVTIDRLRRERNVTLFSGPSARLIYLALDSSRDSSPASARLTRLGRWKSPVGTASAWPRVRPSTVSAVQGPIPGIAMRRCAAGTSAIDAASSSRRARLAASRIVRVCFERKPSGVNACGGSASRVFADGATFSRIGPGAVSP